jgi:hypothetical protein
VKVTENGKWLSSQPPDSSLLFWPNNMEDAKGKRGTLTISMIYTLLFHSIGASYSDPSAREVGRGDTLLLSLAREHLVLLLV